MTQWINLLKSKASQMGKKPSGFRQVNDITWAAQTACKSENIFH